MKSAYIPALLAFACSIGVSFASPVEDYAFHAKYPPRLLPRQANSTNTTTVGRDCGTATVKCERAEGACNNACYAINCVNPAYSTFTFVGPTATPANRREATRNRQQSGANTGGGTGKPACGAVPFSQKVRDPAVEERGFPVDAPFDTDEWPMASSQQDDFEEGVIRNALRCIPDGENRRLGRRVSTFINSQRQDPDTPGKTCPGRVRRDDYFEVEFDVTGANSDLLQYCIPQASTGQVDCSNDGFQFHLSELNTDTGRFDFPYNNASDNHYQITMNAADTNNAPADILQCSVRVDRNGDDTFSAEIFDVDQNSQGTGNADLEDSNDDFSVDGLAYPVTITKTGAIGSEVKFYYGPAEGVPDPSFGDFTWTTDSVGFSDDIASDGSYCQVGEVTGSPATQSTTCYFPCYAYSIGEEDD